MTPICAVCMIEEHEGHTFEDLKVVNEESYKNLQSEVENLISKLDSKMEFIMITKEELKKKTEICVEEINLRREEQVKKFGDLVRCLREQWKDTRTSLERDIRDIAEVRAVLEGVKMNTKSNRYHEIRNNFAEVRSVGSKISSECCRRKRSSITHVHRKHC